MSEYKRRNILVKKPLQARLLLGYFFFIISGGIFFIVLMGFFTIDSMSLPHVYSGCETIQNPFSLLKQTIVTGWPYLLLGSILLTIAAVRVTHRVAGPLYRFEQTLDNMLSGDLSNTISLRSKDEGKELAFKLNKFNREMSHTIQRVTSDSNAVRELLSQAHQKADDLPEEYVREMQSILWSIEEKNKKIETAARHFTVKRD